MLAFVCSATWVIAQVRATTGELRVELGHLAKAIDRLTGVVDGQALEQAALRERVAALEASG